MRLGMGIVKVEVKIPELRRALEEFKNNQVGTLDRIRHEVNGAVSRYFDQLLNAEMALFLGRPDQRENKRNGFTTGSS